MKAKSKFAAIPYLVWMLIFIIVPLGMVLFFGFTTKGGEFTFDNFTGIAKYAHVFWKSIYLSVIATVICLILAFPLGFLMSRMSEVGQRTMLMLIMLPMWMSFLLRTYGWMTLLENEGLINKFLGLFGIGPFEMINTKGAVVLGMVYNFLPFMILPTYTSVEKKGDTEEILKLYRSLNHLDVVLQFVRSGRIAVTKSLVETLDKYLEERMKEK